MTAETGASACECKPESLGPLKVTTGAIHRIWFEFESTDKWYAVMREANLVFGSGNWRGQPRVKRKLESNRWTKKTIPVWFDVPDPSFATWVSVKHSVMVATNK